MLAEFTHHRQAIINFSHYIGIGNCSGRLSVIFAEPECFCFIEESIHTRGRAGFVEARIDLDEFLLPIVEAELRPEPCVGHRYMMHLLKGRHHGVDSNLQGTILGRMNEARAEDCAEWPLPKKEAAAHQLLC